jgi:hypothetical protein
MLYDREWRTQKQQTMASASDSIYSLDTPRHRRHGDHLQIHALSDG